MDPAPRIVETLHYRQDQVGFLEDGHTHLFVVAADGGAPRQLTSGKWSAGAGELRGAVAMDWTPDSKSIVFEANRDADADLEYERSQLLVVDVASAAVRELVAKPGSWGRPAVSPDGKTRGLHRLSANRRRHTRWPISTWSRSRAARCAKISGDYDRDPINLRWAGDGSGVYFDADDHGSRNMRSSLPSTGGGVKAVTTGVHMLTMDSASKDLMAVGTDYRSRYIRPKWSRYNLRRPGEMTQLTNVNGGDARRQETGEDRGDRSGPPAATRRCRDGW